MSKKILFPIFFFGTASAVFAGIVVYPIFRGITEDSATFIELRQELKQLQEDKTRLREFESILSQNEQEFQRLEELFLDTETPIEFFRFLDATAAQEEIAIEKTPGTSRTLPEDVWPSMQIQIEGAGPYPNILAFLKKVEHAPYLLEIQRISLAENEENQVEFSFSLKIHTKD